MPAGLSGDAWATGAVEVSGEGTGFPGDAGAFKEFGTVGSAAIFEGGEGAEDPDDAEAVAEVFGAVGVSGAAEACGAAEISDGFGSPAGGWAVAGAGLPEAPFFLPTGTVSLLGVTPPSSGVSGASLVLGVSSVVPVLGVSGGVPAGGSGEPPGMVGGALSAGWLSAGCSSAGWFSRGTEPVSRAVGGVAAGTSALSSGWTVAARSKIPASDVHTGLRMEAGSVFRGPNSGSSAAGTHGSAGSAVSAGSSAASTASTASPEAPGGCSGFSSIPRRLRCPTDLCSFG
ncbi:hypothetical protein [Frankia sp. CiP1_Cm_nod1]|uniref:hypothetical protein n=1 Tax=Frankia sp. CiP1_Cm_nod1 TaxID=2897160 RepID=UPI00202421B2